MEELRQMAFAYHSTSSQETKAVVKEFFSAMDPNRNGCITFEEFSEYMKLMGRPQMSSLKFFNELKQEAGSEHLEGIEVLTLYYIIKSGRPFCDGCGDFVKGIYFTCQKCLNQVGSCSFNVCPQCMVDKKYVHNYDHQQFIDPYTLLHSNKMESIENQATTSSMPSAPSYIDSFYNIAADYAEPSRRSTFLNEIRERQINNTPNKSTADRVAILVQIALSFGNFLAAVGACTIM